jgi:WXG100 family type VII secretion target
MPQMGGDLEQLAALKATFAQQSHAIQQVADALRIQLERTHWHGPAADRFRAAWAGEFEPTLRRLQGALEEAGVEVARRREALQRAGG